MFFFVSCGVNKNNVEIINVRTGKILYKVKSGETINGIAKKYGISVKELCRINNFAPFEILSQGQIISLVEKRKLNDNDFDNNKNKEKNETFKENNKENNSVKTNLSELISKNNFEYDEEFTSEIITEYSSEKSSTENFSGTIEKTSNDITSSSERFGLIDENYDDSQNLIQEENEIIEKVHGIKKYKYPVSGKILRNFGEIMQNKEKSEGINIRAPLNVPVFSVADSYLLDSGELVSGFGKMVILQHLDGMISVYAHLKEIKVKKNKNSEDDIIKARTVIGTVGKTGNVRIPQLYFQLRNSRKNPVDPLRYLK